MRAELARPAKFEGQMVGADDSDALITRVRPARMAGDG
jgi:hypothetical protein